MRHRYSIGALFLTFSAVACEGHDGEGSNPSSDAPAAAIRSAQSLGALRSLAVDKALRKIGGSSHDLELLSSNAEEFALTGRTHYRYLFHSRATGGIVQVGLDPAGAEVDAVALREAEREAHFARYGHLRPSLAERLADVSDGEKLWVVLYLPVVEPLFAADSEAWRKSEVAYARRRLLDALGDIEVADPADGSPWLRAHLTVRQIKELSRSELVAAILDAKSRPRQPMSNANHYTLSNINTAHTTYDLLGSGVPVGIFLEYIAPHPNLPFDPYGSRSKYPFKAPCNERCSLHGTEVLGMIQNTNPFDAETPALTNTGGKKGVAPLAEIYNAPLSEIVGTLIRSELFTAAAGNGSHTWTKVNATDLFSSPQAWQALPDNGTAYDTANYTSAPRLDYTLNFPITGKYYIWVRGKCVTNSCGNSDTVHVGLDGVLTETSDRVWGFGGNGASFVWRSKSYPEGDRPYFNVTSTGNHQINVWMREDGFIFDAMVLTREASFVPTDDRLNQHDAIARQVPDSAMDSYAWLASKGVLVVNLSAAGVCGSGGCQQDLADMVADYYATHPPYMLSVFAGGNAIDSGTNGKVVGNFLYNGLVVGAAQPKCYTVPGSCTNGWQSTDRTLDHTVHNWKHENMPGKPDWELPQLVAYGKGLQSSISTDAERAGTSLAAPQVVGSAALVIGGNSDLRGRPEAVKAVLLAGADVNTDLNNSLLGAAYSHQPEYDNGQDRHGGVGLLNVEASAEISRPVRRFRPDNRLGLSNAFALGGMQPQVANVQAQIVPVESPRTVDLTHGSHGGFDFGTLDPSVDFDGSYYKHAYYFQPTASGTLRISLVWNRPFICNGTPISCVPGQRIGLDMILRDLDAPTQTFARANAFEPSDEFLAMPVVAGKTYRLDLYAVDGIFSLVRYGLAAYLTANPQ